MSVQQRDQGEQKAGFRVIQAWMPNQRKTVARPSTDHALAQMSWRGVRVSRISSSWSRGVMGLVGALCCVGMRTAQAAWRRTKTPSSTSTSMRVRRKQSRAWRGVQTIGSFSLKEVLSTIGTPVRS